MAKPTLYQHTETLADNAGPLSGNLITGYGFDPDGDPLTVANIDGNYVAGSIGGGKGSNTFAGTYGTLTVAQDGSYTYTLNPGLNLNPADSVVESFNIKLRDGTGLYASNTLKFVINGTPNQKPNAQDDTFIINSTLVGGNVLVNDSDPDGDALHVGTLVAGGALVGGTVQGGTSYHVTGQTGLVVQGVYGTLTISDNGAFSYQVDVNDVDTINAGGHATETFAYKAHDGQNGQGNNTDYALLSITF